MPNTRSIPSIVTGSNGQKRIRPLPPLPPCGDETSTRALIVHSRALPPLPIGDDDRFSDYAESVVPLTPPPMYDDIFADPSPALPIQVCEEGRHIESSAPSPGTTPALPTWSDTPTLLPGPSTSSFHAPPLPLAQCMSRRPVRPLPPKPDAVRSLGFFTDARDFVLNSPTFTEVINIEYPNEKAVFDILKPYVTLDATKDSNARYPPPQCHAGTRVRIRNKLTNWLYDKEPESKIFCIYGCAGIGKSAIAQTFATHCEELGRLGGTYFFSRLAGRNKAETIIPTLAYQLAISTLEYKSLISKELNNDPLLLQSSPPVQLKRLIAQPFTTLQRERHHDPIIVILDGLDECEGQNAQLMILEMISDSLRTSPDLPLRWLIFSRPEPHLSHKFIRIVGCCREELVVDAECRDEVEQFVRRRVVEIQETYDDVAPHSWPSQEELRKLLNKSSGRYDVASMVLDQLARQWDSERQLASMLLR